MSILNSCEMYLYSRRWRNEWVEGAVTDERKLLNKEEAMRGGLIKWCKWADKATG